jgi:hypothetical protein
MAHDLQISGVCLNGKRHHSIIDEIFGFGEAHILLLKMLKSPVLPTPCEGLSEPESNFLESLEFL